MSIQVDVLFGGFSGKLEVGYLGWGTWALLRDGTHTMVLDTGFVGLAPELYADSGAIRRQGRGGGSRPADPPAF